MVLTPEQKYNTDVWYALQKIKEHDLRRVGDEVIEYKIYVKQVEFVKNEPMPVDEAKIIEQLIQRGAIKETKPPMAWNEKSGNYIANPAFIHFIKIIPKKFDQVYNEYKNKAETNQRSYNLEYEYDQRAKKGILLYGKKRLIFSGDTALVLDYFYNLHEINDEKFKTYHDFNNYAAKYGSKLNSPLFNQSITNINNRISKVTLKITEIIKKRDKSESADNEINMFKWEIKI